MENHQKLLKYPEFDIISSQIINKFKEINSNLHINGSNDEVDSMANSPKNKTLKDFQFLMNSIMKKNKPNLTIISPFGSTLSPDTNVTGLRSPFRGMIGTTNSIKTNKTPEFKSLDYEDDGDFMYDTNKKDNNTILEGNKYNYHIKILFLTDIQMKKRKLDNNGHHVKIIQNST